MACIRHRIKSRKGGFHGGSVRPLATLSLESASASPSPNIPNPYGSFSGRYPDTHSGRGRAQLQGASRRDVVFHTANFPFSPHLAPHSTQFRFRSTLNRPIITATITIVFSEENDPQDAPSGNSGAQQRDAHRLKSDHDSGKQTMDEEMIILHGKALGGGQHAAKGKFGDMQTPGGRMVDTSGPHATAGSSGGVQPARGLQTGMSEEEDDWYKYACLIEEEPALNELK